MPGTGTKIQEL